MPSSTTNNGKASTTIKDFPFHCCLNPQLSMSAASADLYSRSNDNSSTLRYDFATAATSSLYPHIQFTNHESLPKLQESFRSFLRAFPQYLQTVEADHIRAQDYPHLSLSDYICLDYGGYGLFSNHHRRGTQPTTGDEAEPSTSTSSRPPTSSFSRVPSLELSYKSTPVNLHTMLDNETELNFETQFRLRIMQFLNISSDDYSLVFTANQPSAFKIIAETYPFKTNKSLLTVYDHDNEAVDSMVENSTRRGAKAISAEFKWPTMKINYSKLMESIARKKRRKKKAAKKGLFVFPLQSRVTGARYSYQLMNIARENDWHVLLDATALGPKAMDTLGLSLFRPDFLICTCYKVFGQDPSGFSCLFIKKSSYSALNVDSSNTTIRGIVNLVPPSNCRSLNPWLCEDEQAAACTSLSGELHRTDDVTSGSSTPSGEIHRTGGEDINPSSIPRVNFRGLDNADALGLVVIGGRTRYLINWLINAFSSLHHPDSASGQPLVSVYGPGVRLERAPTLAFNLFDWKGERVEPILVQKIAGRNNISVGCGFVKQIWFGERYGEEKEEVLEKRRRKSGGEEAAKRKDNWEHGVSVVTVTVGYLNNFEDVYGLWMFVARFLDADFVEKERWRYTALNQKTVEV